MRIDTTVDATDLALDERPSAALDTVPAARPAPPARRELTASVRDEVGSTVAGISGWTLGPAAGITLLWVGADRQGHATHAALIGAFEDEARRRGCTHVLTTSAVLDAAGRRAAPGYREVFPVLEPERVAGAEVHLRASL